MVMPRKRSPTKKPIAEKIAESRPVTTGRDSVLTQEQLNDLIQKKAYELFEKRGGTPGNEFDDWLEAEKLVKEELKIQ